MTRPNLTLKLYHDRNDKYPITVLHFAKEILNDLEFRFKLPVDSLVRQIGELPEDCMLLMIYADEFRKHLTRSNTREEYEPSFVFFARSSYGKGGMVTHQVPNEGSGSTWLDDFLNAYDKAIEMAEKRGAMAERQRIGQKLLDEVIAERG